MVQSLDFANARALAVSALLTSVLLRLRTPAFCELKLMPLHIHASAAKTDALHPQTESLLRGIFPEQLDRPARSHNPVPGQSWNLAQYAHHLPRRPRPARTFRDRSIARHRSSRQSANAAHDAIAFGFSSARFCLCLCPCLSLGLSLGLRHAATAAEFPGEIMLT